MCLLICLRARDGSLVVAANRDERYDRPTKEPFAWRSRPRILAGRDERAAGTWLAVSERGLVSAVTNRPTVGGEEPSRPSRGGLVVLAGRCESAAAARRVLTAHLRGARYNGFNLFVADAEEAFVVQAPGGRAELEDVAPGVHVAANGGWNDPTDPRVARAGELLAGRRIGPELPVAGPGRELLARLKAVCRDHHGGPGAGSLCAHGTSAGTVSSTLLAVDAAGTLRRYLHAAGPPCRTDFRELSGALRDR